MKSILSLILTFTFIMPAALIAQVAAPQAAANKLKDFRSTNQRVALLGLSSEFVDSDTEDKVLEQMRRSINRYTKSYGAASIASFNLGPNTGKKFFRPVNPDQKMDEFQKKFLTSAGKDNSVEVFVLGGLREEGEDIASELQLYDTRTDSLSKIEGTKFKMKNMVVQIELHIFRLLNYLDREGFVAATSQDFLEMPAMVAQTATASSQQNKSSSSFDSGAAGFPINPTDLSGGKLAGGTVIAGDEKPFWERWWFWALVGGAVFTAGGVATYYFVLKDADKKTSANVSFQLP